MTSPLSTTRIDSAEPRHYARVEGKIVWVQVEPSDAPPQLIARVEDASGRMDAIFMGRRIIPGVEPGRHIVLEGRICESPSIPVMYNPRYELVGTS